MDEMMELWEEIKFEAGTIYNDLIPIEKREVKIGMGDRKASILFIGNDTNLYIEEDYKVAPDSTGEFLLKLLDIVGIEPNMYYVTTLSKKDVKFKEFREDEKKRLIELSLMQIVLVKPKIVVFLGKDTAQEFLGYEINFNEERGIISDWKGNIKKIVTYDIETVIRARSDEGKKSSIATNFWSDIKTIKSYLD